MTTRDEIKNALEQLGYRNPDFYIIGDDPIRFIVYLNNVYFGVWDSNKKTFVD